MSNDFRADLGSRGKNPLARGIHLERQRFQPPNDPIHREHPDPICWDILELGCNPSRPILIPLIAVVRHFNRVKWTAKAARSRESRLKEPA